MGTNNLTMGSNIKVGEIMVKNVITIEKGKGIKDAAMLMAHHNIGSVVVVEGKKAIGILTERDIVRKAVKEGDIEKKVEDIMSTPIIVIKPDNSIEEAAKAMKENKVKRLVVIDDEENLVGIIAEDDIIKILPSLVDLIEEKAYAYRQEG